MIEMSVVVQNTNGIHVRPSNVICGHIADYAGEVTVTSSRGEARLNSIMDLLMLSIEQGTELSIRVTGPDEAVVCQQLADLFQTEFDFPPQD